MSKIIRQLFRIIGYSPGLFAYSLVTYLGFFGFPLGVAVLTSRLFDLLSGKAMAGLNAWTLLALIGATELGRIASQITSMPVFARFVATGEGLLRANMLRSRLFGRPGPLPVSPSEALTRFGDDVDMVMETLDDWIDSGGTIIYLVLAFGIFFVTDWRMGLVVLVLGAAIVIIVRLMYQRIEQSYATARQASEITTGFLGEVLGGVQAVKIAGAEERVGEKFRALGERRRQAEVRSALTRFLTNSFIYENVANLAVGLILVLAAHAVQDGGLTVGELSLFLVTMPRFVGRLSFVGRVIATTRQAGVSISRMAELVDGGEEELLTHRPTYQQGDPPPIRVAAATAPFAGLMVRGLTCSHPDGAPGVADVDLDVAPGTLTVITGRIGAGKSTLLRALLGHAASSGEVRWNGAHVLNPADFFAPPHTAYTPQVPRLFSGTIRENVLMGLPEGEVDLRGALHKAVLGPDLDAMVNGLETVIGPKGARLSGGQVQRVAAARMLVRQPQLLVVDDLSSALDVETEAALWDRVLAGGGTTCLAVSHRRAVLRRADRIIVLKEGRVEAEGRLEELLERSSEFQRLWAAEEEGSA